MSVIDFLSRYTYDDYTLWEGDWELVEGIPVSIAPAPTKTHQHVASELFFYLKQDETVKFYIYEDEKVEYYILIYPNDLKAKVYKLKDDKYFKIGDFTKERLIFKDINCEIELDFEKVFKKFI